MLLFARRAHIDAEGTTRPRSYARTKFDDGLHTVRLQNLIKRLAYIGMEGEVSEPVKLPSSLKGLVDDHDNSHVDLRHHLAIWKSMSCPEVDVDVPFLQEVAREHFHDKNSIRKAVTFAEDRNVEIPVFEQCKAKSSPRHTLKPKAEIRDEDEEGCLGCLFTVAWNYLVEAPAPEAKIYGMKKVDNFNFRL